MTNNWRKVCFYFLVVLFLTLHFAFFKRLGLFKLLAGGSRVLLDFDNYHRTVLDIFAGQHPYRVSYAHTLGPPLVFVSFLPFGLFSLNSARIFITGLNLLSAYLLSYILAKQFFPKQKLLAFLILSLLLLSSFPARFNILMGQPILIAALLLTIFMTTKSSFLKGICLGSASVIKTFLVFCVLSLVKKDRKSLVWFLVLFFGIIILFFPLVKSLYYIDYFKERFFKISFASSVPDNLDYYNQSLGSTMFRFGVEGFYLPGYLFFLFVSGGFLLISGNFELSVVLALLVSPVCWQHYFVLLFPVMVKLFCRLVCRPWLMALLGLSLLMWWGEMPWIHKAEINFLNGVLASHYFLSAVILACLVIVEDRKWIW